MVLSVSTQKPTMGLHYPIINFKILHFVLKIFQALDFLPLSPYSSATTLTQLNDTALNFLNTPRKKYLVDTNKSTMMTREKGGWVEVEEGKGG